MVQITQRRFPIIYICRPSTSGTDDDTKYVGNNTFTYINSEPMGEVTDITLAGLANAIQNKRNC